MHTGQQRQHVQQDEEAGDGRHDDRRDLEQHAARAALRDAEPVGTPADGGGAEGRRADRGERGDAEAHEDDRVLGLQYEGVSLVRSVQLPHGAQALPHRADPADAGEQQQRTRHQAHGARVGDQRVEIELVGDAGHLVGELVLEPVELVLAEQRGTDRRAHGDQRKERQEADEGDRRREPGPVRPVEGLAGTPGVRQHQPGHDRPDDGESFQPVHDGDLPSDRRTNGRVPRKPILTSALDITHPTTHSYEYGSKCGL